MRARPPRGAPSSFPGSGHSPRMRTKATHNSKASNWLVRILQLSAPISLAVTAGAHTQSIDLVSPRRFPSTTVCVHFEPRRLGVTKKCLLSFWLWASLLPCRFYGGVCARAQFSGAGDSIMASRVVIQHLSGAKANQIEQFPLEGLVELTMGRDP